MGCSVQSGFPGQLFGVVLDSKSKKVLPGASISSPCWPGVSMPTNKKGLFVFPLVNGGQYDFVVSKAGYVTQTISNVVLLPNKVKHLKVQLVPSITKISGTIKFLMPGTDPTFDNDECVGSAIKLLKSGVVVATQVTCDGNYNFENLAAGTYQISASISLGELVYKTSSAGITIESGDSVTCNLALPL